MMGQIGIPVDTELCSAVWDYGFPVWFRNPGELSFAPFGSEAWWGWVAALLMWLVCCWAGPLAGWFPVGDVKSFGEPHSIESSLVVGGSCALCYSRHDFQYPV